MVRPLVVGNGQMLVCLDHRMIMRDLYYPYVGQVNHVVGQRNQIGLWVDGAFSWLSDGSWQRRLAYRKDSLVIDSQASHEEMGVELSIGAAVHYRENIFLQHVRIKNLQQCVREARLFATFDFDLDGTDVGDTVLWDPDQEVIIHYKRARWFLIGAAGPQGGIFQYATGRKRFMGAEGTWRDAEDGWLEGHPIHQGAVDSTISILVPLEPEQSADAYLWVCCAQDVSQARAYHHLMLESKPDEMLSSVDRYWRSWVSLGSPDLALLPTDLLEAYRRSLLLIRTQMDNHGAILAANDSDILEFNRDHYSYMWPRDGAFVASALDRAGYTALTEGFYRFCQRALTPDGFFWHRYHPDGTMGSSWHPWLGVKGPQLPIQEDETALILWAFGDHYRMSRNQEFAADMYADMVRPAADFLMRYRDERTGLPLESYDLWEERRGVFTFTVASVVAGLNGAATVAMGVGDHVRAERYQYAASEVRAAMLRHLWSEERRRFLRGIYVRSNGDLLPDETLDSSLAGIFLLGALPPHDAHVEATMRAIEEGLWVKTRVGGIARYEKDYYFRVEGESPTIAGNPWVICTLWLARWYVARARSEADLEPALRLVLWVLHHALPTGILPEQVHPFSGEPLSVAPLTWSHSTLVDTFLDLSQRLTALLSKRESDLPE